MTSIFRAYLRASLLCFAAPLALVACQAADKVSEAAAPAKAEAALDINFEKITLDNGLDVIFHVDRSDPVVAINLAAHVGSARETAGRTGFAHLFEHLLFLDSENLGYGGLDEMNTRIGGEGTNGFTSNDMTQYFQAVPKDALEKVIWAEADKLGWFIKTVKQDVIDNEKQVVKNEKRQRVDNAPYGHNWFVVNKALYPTDHPYNWQVIGSLDDLDAASLKDTQDFYARWYVPNNVTITISGDFDVAQAKTWVQKYFGEIPRGEDIEAYGPRPGKLDASVKLIHEDNFATVPRLTHVWPTVEQYHPDSYALTVLSRYLAASKTAPFYEVLVDEEKLSPWARALSNNAEIAGEFYIITPSNAGTDLDDLMPAIDVAFKRFEETGIPQKDLDRIKAVNEVSFYGNFGSVLTKAITLSGYNLFTGDPGAYKAELDAYRSVTREDVMRVYQTYIKDKPAVITSFVPMGKSSLGVEGSTKADVVEEVIVEDEGTAVKFDPAARVIENPTPSSFDRTVEPDFGKSYNLPSPKIWQTTYDNGLKVLGITSDETPEINFNIRLDAGRLRNPITSPALAGMTADMLSKGTANKTTAELQDAIGALGSDISISANANGTFISGTTLSRNFEATMALAKEMIFEPRWDAEEFTTLKNRIAQSITESEGNPNSIASREMAKLRYPDTSPLHYVGGTGYGSAEALETLTLEDLKAFHSAYYTLNGATLRLAGDFKHQAVRDAFAHDDFGGGEALPPVTQELTPVTDARIYFFDVPGAKQSVIRMSRPALAATDADYPLANAVNFPLGGIYTSKLNTTLRVEKGYTYSIGSGFSGARTSGTFGLSTSVRSNVTKESLVLIREVLSNHGPETTEAQLSKLKDALLRGQALNTETLGDKLDMLGQIDTYDYTPDYLVQNAKAVAAMTIDDFKRIAEEHINPDAMLYLVIGDAATQADAVRELGLPVTEIK